VIVIGAGLSGLTAAISLVDRGGKVILVEKNAYMGGNSAYASSGINAVDPQQTEGDTV
jgi:succinate dehydrogenase/fumarate reductase flavoprotein subunit